MSWFRYRLSYLLVVLAAHCPSFASEFPRTYCNPLPIPNYPVGRFARGVTNGSPLDENIQWLLPYKEQFRELADPSALWENGKWYLYPSVDMAWVSEDQGATWEHHPLNVRDLGYAPTVVKYGSKFYLLASESELHVSDSPLGPFSTVGKIQIARQEGMPPFVDPMLFADDDGKLYYYWGCSAKGGIWGAELNPSSPTHPLTGPVELIKFDPLGQPWEAVGEWNQIKGKGWIEGAWMIKRSGRYYLTYSAAGTENKTYAMGAYVGHSPLGPFSPQRLNPILRTTSGLVTGTAHGCIVAGPNNELWAFYTIRAGVAHGFERRIGMDRVQMSADGELFVPSASSIPQWLPKYIPSGQKNGPDWIPLNAGCQTFGSSNAPNLGGRFAVDGDLRTWWQPASNDTAPMLTSRLNLSARVHAVRIVWRDVGLDTTRGVNPGPYRYRVEVESKPGEWNTIVDRTQNDADLLIDYRECKPMVGSRVRLVLLGWPPGITPGVAEFTVFGQQD